MENELLYDLIVVGLGPGGLRAVNIALENNMSVLAFEKEAVGGCCLNKGCIPTKAILHSSEVYKEFKNSNKLGLEVEGEIKADIQKIIDRKNKIVSSFNSAAAKELTKKGAEIIFKKAEIDFENLVVNKKYKAKNIIIATGSMPFELPNLPFDGDKILSSDDVLNMNELPNSIAIIGSGAIGIEWARIFSNLGVQTTIIEKAPNLLPLMDTSIQKRMDRMFKIQRVKTYTNKTAIKFENNKLILDDNTEIEIEKILVAVGRKRVIPNGLTINKDLTTNYKNVYAIGDIIATKMLAHTASMQADFVMNKILNKKTELTEDEMIPSVIYGNPEIASIGINEQDIENIEEYKIYNLPITFLPKSWCDNQTEGFIKIITKDNLIKGAHIVSSEASSLITQIQIMMKTNYKVSEIKDIVFAHPTYSEGIYETIING